MLYKKKEFPYQVLIVLWSCNWGALHRWKNKSYRAICTVKTTPSLCAARWQWGWEVLLGRSWATYLGVGWRSRWTRDTIRASVGFIPALRSRMEAWECKQLGLLFAWLGRSSCIYFPEFSGVAETKLSCISLAAVNLSASKRCNKINFKQSETNSEIPRRSH